MPQYYWPSSFFAFFIGIHMKCKNILNAQSPEIALKATDIYTHTCLCIFIKGYGLAMVCHLGKHQSPVPPRWFHP